MTGYSPLKNLAREYLLGVLLLGWPLHAQAAIYSVTSSADSGAGTLRQAILNANANPGSDTITFNLPLASLDIVPLSPLPEIVDPVILNGTTQPGFTKTPLVAIRGAGSGEGLRVGANGSTVTAIRVTGFETGIRVTGAACTIASCHVLSNTLYGILLETAGSTVRGNYVAANFAGIRFQAGETNSLFGNFVGIHPSTGVANGNSHGVFAVSGHQFIGGTGTDEGNVISGNTIDGIALGPNSENNTLRGNLIGTDTSGTTAVPNGTGIWIDSGYNTVGGIKAGSRNLVSGNLTAGIVLNGYTTFRPYNRIEGNYIGTDISGSFAVPNGTGIVIQTFFAYSNTVGSVMAAGRNLISGNTGPGIYIHQALGTSVKGNYIGTDASGTVALPNGTHGVYVESAPRTAIGGTGTEAGNLISGNARGIYSSASDHVVIQGNRVGTTASGLVALGNTYVGIVIHDSMSNILGGVSTDARNIVSGNGLDGIALYGAGHVVQGNYLGLGADGETPLPNGAAGLLLSGVQNVTVGGDLLVGGGNRISANGAFGIHVMNSSECEFIGNWIGGHPVGAGFGGNRGRGIFITGNSFSNLVGGDIWSRGNSIAYNEGAGIAVGSSVHNVNAVGNRIDWNWIYHNHGLGIDLGSDGPTPNDTMIGGDPDDGPNNLQNVPVITNVVAEGANLRIQGYLKSGVNQSYKINVYGNPQFDPSGYGEGEIMLGAINLSTAPLDTGSFDLTVPAPDPIPDYVSATATHVARGDTSEFSHFALLDSDGDGMPDGWEQRYFGSPTGGVSTAHGDTDGVTNLEEFLADTDPTDSDSVLRITAMDVAHDGLGEPTLGATFPSSLYRHYRIEYSEAGWLTAGTWLAGTVGYQPGTGDPMHHTQARPTGTTSTLVRIRARLP